MIERSSETNSSVISSLNPDIRQFSAPELIDLLTDMGEKKFRAKQVHEWLWKKSAHSFDEMTNLSKDLRERLKETFLLRPIVLDMRQD